MIPVHQRAFGVEIECGFPAGYSRAERLFTWDRGFSVGSDGTDIEIRTPKLKGLRGFKTLKATLDTIRAEGGYVTPSDGMHVHHDAPEFVTTPSLCLPLVEAWRANQDLIHGMVAPRRQHNGACPVWSDMMFEALKLWVDGSSPYLSTSRHDLNLTSLRDHGSIEIRLHEGTLDPDVAIAWIQFGQTFIHEVVQENAIPKAHSDSALLEGIRLSPEAKAMLMAKKEQGHETPLTMFEARRKPREAYAAAGGADDFDEDDYYDDDYGEDYCDCDMCRDIDERDEY